MTIDYATPTPRRKTWRTVLLVLGVLGVIGALLVGGMAVFMYFAFRGPTINYLDFDSVKWQAASKHDPSYNSVRLRMVDSFLKTQHPMGKSRDQIVARLGPPDDTPYFNNYDMVYYLGPERGAFAIDSEWIVFKLKDGVVVEASLVTD